MPARAMWKGVLRIDGERLGVKLYSAVEDQQIRFHLLHDEDRVRIRQRLVNPRTQETVASEETIRAVETAPGVFVVLDEKELEAATPEPSRDIDILRFVPQGKLDHRWYDRPYYLGPDEHNPERYFALIEALERTEREGVARWAMRKREYVGALRVHEGHLALVALRFAEEVLELDELQVPTGRAIEERERKLARQLIETLAGEFNLEEFRDEYRERVLELIADKQKGKRVQLKRFKAKPVRDTSLASMLEASLHRAA